jgi:hypothetical protein
MPETFAATSAGGVARTAKGTIAIAATHIEKKHLLIGRRANHDTDDSRPAFMKAASGK